MATYVITGANRGLGLALAQHLAAEGNQVIGTARDPSTATTLSAIPGVHVVALELTDPESSKTAAAEVTKLTGGAVDVLIANAGYYSETLPLDFETYPSDDALIEDMKTSFDINAIGAVLTIKAFLPLLKAGKQKKVVYISTPAGNPQFSRVAKNYMSVSYGVSKAAADYAVLKFAIKYADEGFIFMSLSPGGVDTSATAKVSAIPTTPEGQARFMRMVESFLRASPKWDRRVQTPEEAAAKCIDVINKLKPEDNGRFLTHHGDETTWF
ncbi:NAD-P-binding protein [Calocera viscosa TUFC12733]|uniref:NAD-P-binding protein n=1 Tax=Calocera viscosa (strain TUFC12733) TaxID=1330018 RepID=A0A167KPV8_CALVF|nr:NAD-P-binding protein [Calocera viscosa TUFC12733]